MAKIRTSKSIMVFFILLLLLVVMVFFSTEIFQVDKITVLGSKTVEDNVIIGLSGITYGDNILKVSRKSVKTRIEDNPPYMIVSSVLLRIPDEVVITVEERIPVAVVPYLSSYILMDAEGFILDILKQNSEAAYPAIEGLRLKSLTKGRLLSVADNDQYKERILYRVLDAVRMTETEGFISVIDVDNPDDIRLSTRDGYDIILGTAVELDKKLSWLLSDGYTQILLRRVPGIMDVSVSNKMVFRPMNILDEVED